MRPGKLNARLGTFLLFAVLASPASLAGQGKQGFEVEVDGAWPVKKLEGDSAWAYDMAGFFHIGLDARADKQWISLDISKKGVERPVVGKHPIGTSKLSGFAATLEIRGDDKSTVRSGSGELEIIHASPEGIEGRFTFKSSTVLGEPEISVSGKFVAKERPSKREPKKK
jgi:hypothetical protein